MARPLQDKFDKDSPLSPPSAGSASTPISYSVNVNRSKTKKWAETKPVDYGGDDWGDDYDDYEPPPLSKPTGLRQPGQVAQSPIVAGPPKIEGNKRAYGDLPSLPDDPQARSLSNPVRDRANSFTKDDERRTFSSGHGQLPLPAPSAALIARSSEPSTTRPSVSAQGNIQPILHVSTQVPPVTGLRKVIQPSLPLEAQKSETPVQVDEPQSGVSSKYSEATSKYSDVRTPVSDFQARRDFSPSAVPSPLQPNPSAAPSSVPNSATSRFPPRKSSISRPTPPNTFETSQSPQAAAAQKPWVDPQPISPSSPVARGKSPTAGGNAVPLVRPSDIYKRIGEEREKERQSTESNRPSMESIIGSRSIEGSSSQNQAAQATHPTPPVLRGRSSSDSLGRTSKKIAVPYIEPEYDYGRHLAPTLEPVSERKSEYGFEGFDPAAFREVSAEGHEISNPNDLEESQRDPEKIRRFSVSPKLPDLNRISRFDIDLFSQANVGGTSHPGAAVPPIPENRAATSEVDLKLRTQPSLGFTSVVHQAFDAESQSVPETPASGRPARSGSESTGTTGISPIMSRVPGSITRNRDLEAQETTIPAIAEVDEPGSEAQKREQKQNYPENPDLDLSENLPLRPEYRRNISTPSPGNSPARTPLVENGEKRITAEESHASPVSDHGVSPVDVEEDLHSGLRPSAEREKSFRPNLPGGWVSYGTTASDPAVERDPSTHQRSETPNIQTETSHTPVSPISEMSDDEVDLTPTTTKRQLHQSALGAAAGAAFGGAAAAAFARRGRESPRSSSPTVTSAPATRTGLDNGALPTPDPALASITNPYSAHALDPRLATITGDHEAALQVPSTSEPVSSASTVPPRPPPKDTPVLESLSRSPDYFPPTVPLKLKTADEIAANEGLESPMRPRILPTLSTHTSPQDEESDKLRKEIIKTLSPTTSNAAESQRLLPPYPPEPRNTEHSTAEGTRESTYETRESTYLPSEYDNYWESTDEANPGLDKAEEVGQETLPRPEPTHGSIQPISKPRTDAITTSTAPPVSTSSSDVVDGTNTQPTVERPPLRSHRFSWEAGPEQVSANPMAVHPELQEPTPAKDVPLAASPDTQGRPSGQNVQARAEQGPIGRPANSPVVQPIQANPAQDNGSKGLGQGPKDQLRPSDQSPATGHFAGGIGMAAGVAGAAGAAGVAALVSQKVGNDGPQRRLSLAEEKSPANVSSYAVSPEPPEEEHPARSSLPIVSPIGPPSVSPASATQPPNPDSVVTPSQQRASGTANIRQFRDILSVQDPEQRIRAYDDTRDQFRQMDTGLNDWIKSLDGQHQLNNTGPWPNPADPGVNNVRPKAQTQTTPLQQPYYQQYLNASPSTPATQSPRPGTGTMPSSQQGSASVAGKSPGQQNQNQSKGKGIFGGKAGKGLFSMSKNKFRGSGGGDKNSPPPEASPTPRAKDIEGRRSSWGMSMTSLTLPRLGRTDTSSQHSREATPTRQIPSPLGQETRLSPTKAPVGTVGQSERSIMDEPVSAVSSPSIHHAALHASARDETDTSREFSSVEDGSREVEQRDGLGVPAPIGKQQPSWDPYNTTPIAEEEGFQYDDRSSKQLPAAPAPANQSVAPVVLPIRNKLDQPISGDSPTIHGTREAPNDADDWVIVPKDEEISKNPEVQSQTGPPVQNAAPTTLPLTKSQAQPPIDPRKAFGPPGSEGLPRGYQTQPNYQPEAARQQPVPPQPQPQPVYLPQPISQSGQQPVPPQPQPSYLPQANSQPGPIRQQPGPPQAQSGPQPQAYFQPGGVRQQQVPPQAQFSPQSQTNHQPRAGPPPQTAAQPLPEPQPSDKSHGGFRGRFMQHIRQRSSKDNAFPTDKPSPQQHVRQGSSQSNILPLARPPAIPNLDTESRLREQVDDNKSPISPMKQSPDFVGLPPIRRSSTFGLGFRPKAAKERFPLEDDSDEGESTIGRGFNSPQAEGGGLPQGEAPRGPTTSHINASNRPGEVANGPVTRDHGVRNQTNQLSSEPSRYSFVEGQNSEIAVESPERPPITSKSSEYSQASGVAPSSVSTSPPLPVIPSDIPQHLVGGPPSSSHPSYEPTEARPEDAWRPNIARPSREQRDGATTPRPLSFEQGGTYITHIRQPSQEQRPPSQSTHQRGPSFDGQRQRPPSSSSQSYQGPNLPSGVYVPPPRNGPTQPKQFEQPPSSAQRYPDLFKPELAKETSVDGLPANYYQRPISREDALLPRQQTNEYQLPGVGPPPDQPQPGRNSRRNSGLFKELGGRLSRSASRDRESAREDDPQSPVRTTQSRNSHARDVSEASVTSEETLDEKRGPGLGIFGTLRRESTTGQQAPKSRESLVTHLPPSRTDSIPMLQQQTSLPPPPDKKKTFFGFGRSSTDDLKAKPNKLSRVSTNSIVSEQEGKKKRFSGLTAMFSRPSVDQERKDPAVAAAQDPRNYPRSSFSAQGHPNSGDPRQGMTQGFQHPQGQPGPNVQGMTAQQPLRYAPGPYPQNSGPTPNGAPLNFQSTNAPRGPQQFQGQPPVGAQIAGSRPGYSSPLNQIQGPPQGPAPNTVQNNQISQPRGQAPNNIQISQVSQTAPGSGPQPSQRQGPPQGQHLRQQNSQGTQDTQEILRLAALNGRPGPPGQLQAPQPPTQGLETRGKVQQSPPTNVTGSPRQSQPNEKRDSSKDDLPSPGDRASSQQSQLRGSVGPPQQAAAIENRDGFKNVPPLDSRSSFQQGLPIDDRSGFKRVPPLDDSRPNLQQGLPVDNRISPQLGYISDNKSSFQQGLDAQNRVGLLQGAPANFTGPPRQGPIDSRNIVQQGPSTANAPAIQQNSTLQQRGNYQQGLPVGPGHPPNAKPIQAPQQPQSQQYLASSPAQSTAHPSTPPRAMVESSPPGRSPWAKPSPAPTSQAPPDTKSRKKSSTGLFSGLLGGNRRSSAQSAKDDKNMANVSPQPTMAPNPLLQPQQQKQPPLMHPKPVQARPIQPQVLQQPQQLQPQIQPQQKPPQQVGPQQVQPQQMQPQQMGPQQIQPQQIQPQQMGSQQIQQQQMQPQQQQQFAQGPSGPKQERGRTLTQEPLYASPPIPGAYNLVRGDGNQLAPTPYDPRGLNQAFPPGNSPYGYAYQGQPHPMQLPYVQGQPYAQGPPPNSQRSNGPSPLVLAPQNPDVDIKPSLGPYQQSPRRSARPLSTEDLVARSPARPQFGQQAPYQLTLPNDGEEDTEEETLPSDRNPSQGTQLPLGGNQFVYKGLAAERTPPTERQPLNTNILNPALRHPMSPATYPLPEETVFSPVNPSASKLPLPSPPNWPGPTEKTQDLDRSNMRNMQTDQRENSRPSGQLTVPSQPIDHALGNKDGPASVTPPSPQITPQISPDRSPALVNSPHAAASQSSEDIYSASPLPSPSPSGKGAAKALAPAAPVSNGVRPTQFSNGNVQVPNSRPSPIKIPEQQTQPAQQQQVQQVQQQPPQQPNQHLSPPLTEKVPVEEGKESAVGMGSRRRPSQEEKILVEEGMIRPGSANTAVQGQGQGQEDEAPSMSATSYPGQEWNPYGGAYEEWD